MKKHLINARRTLLETPKKLVLTYIIVYFLWGLGMNKFGTQMEIARFSHWWQVITCYILYMVPISILLKNHTFFNQYAYGLVAMGILEFMGYWLQTSYVYPDNSIEQLFNPQNLSLGMALFFALYFPTGNWLVEKIYNAIFKTKKNTTFLQQE